MAVVLDPALKLFFIDDVVSYLLDESLFCVIFDNHFHLFEVPINFIYKREELSTMFDSVYKSSDPYIKMTSFYIQNRRAKVYNNKYNEAKDKEKDEAFEKLLQ